MKYSKQREMILNCIKASSDHLTADAVYKILKKESPNLSLGTVYRNLALLAEYGMVLKISIPGEPDRYDGLTSEHFHFFCLNCGKVQDLFIDELSSIESIVARKADIYIETCEISFKGICTACKVEKQDITQKRDH